ncbi:MAG: MG2 domain-containing protein, partial [Bdellovibrionota bacterium]
PRQARVVFSEPIVSFGDPRGVSPFKVDCSIKGKGLWEDTRTWIYEFDTELPAGESCTFKADPALKSEKGTAWTGKDSFSFNTGGPAVKGSDPYEQGNVEQKPAFLLLLDGPVDPASVEKNAYFLVEGMSERLPLKVLDNKLREEISRRTGRWFNYAEDEMGDGSFGEVDMLPGMGNKKKKPNVIGVESVRTLPPGKKIKLVWGKGVASPKGMATLHDQAFEFQTEDDFNAKFHCERENEEAPCLPIGDLFLNFSAPIDYALASKIQLKYGKVTLTPFSQEKKKKKSKRNSEDEVSSVQFKGPFPPNASFRLELPPGLKDDRGRPLTNAASFPLEFKTGGYPPLAKFSSTFGILEAADPVLPVTLRGVEPRIAGTKLEGTHISVGPENPAKLLEWVFKLKAKTDNYVRYQKEVRIDTRGEALLAGEPKKEKFELPKPNGGAAFEVVGIPLGKKGFHVVEIGSRLLGTSLLGEPAPMYVASGALVTNMAVHLKWGVENSLVWVTSLDKGEPVKGAKVRASDCSGKILWEGKTGDDGAAIAAGIPSPEKVADCQGKDFSRGVAVVAEKDDDFSLVYSGWDNGIEEWRFHVNTGGPDEEVMAHTVFDRTLLRAGQTVHMKHFLREGYLRGIRFRTSDMPRSVVLLHSNGKRIVLPVKFDANGVAETEWQVPKEAELGGYSVYLTANETKAAKGTDGEEGEFRTWGPGVYSTGAFRVEEFRLPVMAGSLQWPKGALVGATAVSADLNVKYLAGGGASGLAVKVRSRAERQEGTTFENFEDFEFANGGVKTGRFNRGENRNKDDKGEKVFKEQNLTLDAGGGGRVTVKGIPEWDKPIRLSFEAEYHDPNGAAQSVSRSTT